MSIRYLSQISLALMLMYWTKINLAEEIKRYESLRDQCDRMIENTPKKVLKNGKESYVHAFRDICSQQIYILKKAVSRTDS